MRFMLLPLGLQQITLIILQPIEARRHRRLAVAPLAPTRVVRKRDFRLLRIVAAPGAAGPLVSLHASGVVARAVASGIGRPLASDGEVKGAVGRDAGGNQVDADFGNRVFGEDDGGPGSVGCGADAICVEEGEEAEEGGDDSTDGLISSFPSSREDVPWGALDKRRTFHPS